MNGADRTDRERTDAPPGDGKRAYSPPALTLFGQVAALTQSSSNCTDDNAICQPPATNMGPTIKSDRRLKDHIVRIGTHPLGIGLYLFEYKAECLQGQRRRRFGVMADEVERVVPSAVHVHPDGYQRVNLEMLGIRTHSS